MSCCPVRSASCGVGKRSVKQLCNPLDADRGAPRSPRRPSDWLGTGTRDRHVAILAQPASVSLETEWRCCRARKWGRCWSHNGPACCRGKGRLFFLVLSENWWFFFGTGFTATCQTWRQGRLPPSPLLLQHRRWISCVSDPGFLTEEEEGGRGRSVKGSLVRKSYF